MDTKAMLLGALILAGAIIIVPAIVSLVPYLLMGVGLFTIARMLVRLEAHFSATDEDQNKGKRETPPSKPAD